MNQKLSYQGYTGTVETSLEDDVLYGKIEHIDDLVTYEGNTVAELRAAFEESVDDYLEWCREAGRDPAKSYSGNFNVRVGPDRHKQLAEIARQLDESINKVICRAVDAFVDDRNQPARGATLKWVVRKDRPRPTVVEALHLQQRKSLSVGVTKSVGHHEAGDQLRKMFERQAEWRNDEPQKRSH